MLDRSDKTYGTILCFYLYMCSQEHNPAKITDCQLVRDLILSGVDINCVDKRSRNALQILLSFCKSIGMV